MNGWINTDHQKPEDEQRVLGYWAFQGGCAETLTFHACDSPVDGRETWVSAFGENADPPDYWQPWVPPQFENARVRGQEPPGVQEIERMTREIREATEGQPGGGD